jgi:trk system potassium uptake protein
MYAIIVGAGNTGRHLAETLIESGHTVTVIERHASVIQQLPSALAERTIDCDGADPRCLERAGINRADVVVATTNEDEDNLVICSLAKREYRVPRTVARVNDPDHAWMFTRDLGVDVSISQAHILSQLIVAEVTVGELTTVLRLREGEVVLVEETIAEKSRANGRKIGDLTIPADAVPVALLRGPAVLVPADSVTLRAGDRLVCLAPQSCAEEIATALA